MSAADETRHRPSLAIGLRLMAVALMAVVQLLAKLTADEGVSISEFIFWRQFMSLGLLLLIFVPKEGLRRFRTARLSSHALRSLAGLLGIYLYIATFRLLPLAEATLTGFTAPVFAVLISALVLKEHVGPYRWAAVGLGLLGVAIVAAPGTSELPLLGLAAGIGNAILIAITSAQLRDLGKTESSNTIVFWYCLFSFPIALFFAFPDLHSHSPYVWAMLLLNGFFSLAAQLCVTGSLRFGSVGTVIVMDYTGIAWSVLFGWFIFSQLPNPMTWVGAPIVIASSLIIILRERHLIKSGNRSSARSLEVLEN